MRVEKRPLWHEFSVDPNPSDACTFSLRQPGLMSRLVTPSGAGREIKLEASCRGGNPGGPAGPGGRPHSKPHMRPLLNHNTHSLFSHTNSSFPAPYRFSY